MSDNQTYYCVKGGNANSSKMSRHESFEDAIATLSTYIQLYGEGTIQKKTGVPKIKDNPSGK